MSTRKTRAAQESPAKKPRKKTSDDGLRDILASWTAELLAPANRVDSLIGNRHQPTKGQDREVLVRHFLRRVIPKHLTVSTGFVYYWEKGASRQQDVIIWNSAIASPLLESGELAVVTGDAVCAVIEVKSLWTDARKAFETLHSIHDSSTPKTDVSARSCRRGGPPFRAVVVFEKKSGFQLFKPVQEYYQAQSWWPTAKGRLGPSGETNMIDAVCSVRGAFLWQHPRRPDDRYRSDTLRAKDRTSLAVGMFTQRLLAFLRGGNLGEPEKAVFKMMAAGPHLDHLLADKSASPRAR